MRDNQQIRFSGEGDQEPDLEPGDIVIVLDEQENSTFKRRGNDLVMSMHIELVEALCGFQKTIQTMDGRTLVITSLPGRFSLCHGPISLVTLYIFTEKFLRYIFYLNLC